MMDPVMLDVERALRSIREYYPDFLTELGWSDSPLARVSFLGAMILAVMESPMADFRAQDIVLQRLKIDRSVAATKLRADILKRLMEGGLS